MDAKRRIWPQVECIYLRVVFGRRKHWDFPLFHRFRGRSGVTFDSLEMVGPLADVGQSRAVKSVAS